MSLLNKIPYKISLFLQRAQNDVLSFHVSSEPACGGAALVIGACICLEGKFLV